MTSKNLIIGETIMSLLLKLDTFRKLVVKELLGLQEKLDSLTFVKSETLSETIEESQEDDGGKIRNTALEPQVESQNEENIGGLNNDHEVEAADPIHDLKSEQLVEQISGELNKDHVQAQSRSNDEAVKLL
ncbi:unnamed protein product [Lactuca virosa]|uniref:Uncharacterized protein n=1 Tax=Lactuca virosa TaxID=75947 RepID=A0AAU9PHB3_9ASTR|nr:unnamed protein product [Lactuca virosa]